MLQSIRLLFLLLNPSCLFLRRSSPELDQNLLLTLVIEAMHSIFPDQKIIVQTDFPEIFHNNPKVHWVTHKHLWKTDRHIHPRFRIRPRIREPIHQQLIYYVLPRPQTRISMGIENHRRLLAEHHKRVAEYEETINELNNQFKFPRIYLTDGERSETAAAFPEPYIAFCSHSQDPFSENLLDWQKDSFQQLLKMMGEHKFVQIGHLDDELIPGAIDARGRSIRKSAAIIAGSMFFLGLNEVFMHLAKAVQKRSLIVSGGAIDPKITTYPDDIVLSEMIDCSPCFSSEKNNHVCDHKTCMTQITPQRVREAIQEHMLHLTKPAGMD